MKKGVFITPAFPKLIYVVEEDNILKIVSMAYLTELAAKCTAKRLWFLIILAKSL